MFEVLSGTLQDQDFMDLYGDQIYRLRHKVFKEQLKWDVNSENGREMDQYDDEHSRYFVVKEEGSNDIIGTWRLRLMSKPNMTTDVFSFLVDGEIPRDDDWVEVSRWALDHTKFENKMLGFGLASRALMDASVEYAVENGIKDAIIVSVMPLIGHAKQMGWDIELLGKPRPIGAIPCVAIRVPLNDRNINVACNNYHALKNDVA